MDSQKFRRMLEAVGAARVSAPAQDTFLPYWSMVTRKSEVLQEMRSSGSNQAEHAATCNTSDCKLHFTTELTWLTPEYFQQYITVVLGETIRQWSERASMSDELKDQIDTASIYVKQWADMTAAEIEKDPRYRAYQVGFNEKLLEYIITSYSFRVPTH